MAAQGSSCLYQGDKSLAGLIDFEGFIKDRLTWSKEKWRKEGEEYSKMKTFINSLRYWGKKLSKALEPKNIVLTLFDVRGDISQYLTEIVDAILCLEKDIKIVGFSMFRNSKYMALYFENDSMKNLVENKLKIIDGKYVAYLSWIKDSIVKNVSLQWVPLHVDMNIVREELNKYLILKEESREERKLMNGMILPSDTVKYKAVLRPEINLEEIPQIVDIAGFEALLTIQGKIIECFTCKKKGHKSKVCNEAFCVKCECLMLKTHECNRMNEGDEEIAVLVNEEGSCNTTRILQKIVTSDASLASTGQETRERNNDLDAKMIVSLVLEKDECVSIGKCAGETGNVGKASSSKNGSLVEDNGRQSLVNNTEERSADVQILESKQNEVRALGAGVFSLSETSDEEEDTMEVGARAMGVVEKYLAELNSFGVVNRSGKTELPGFIKEAGREILDINIKKKAKKEKKVRRSETKDKVFKKTSKNANKLIANLPIQEIRRSYGKKEEGNNINNAEVLFDSITDKG